MGSSQWNPIEDASKDYSLTKFKFVLSDYTVVRRLGNYTQIHGEKAWECEYRQLPCSSMSPCSSMFFVGETALGKVEQMQSTLQMFAGESQARYDKLRKLFVARG